MNTRWLLVIAAFVLAACGKPENPLLAASDGQFAQLIEPRNAFSPSCAAALYEPDLFVKQYNGLKFSQAGKISAVSDQQKTECAAELPRRGAAAGVRRAHSGARRGDAGGRPRVFAPREGEGLCD